MAKKEDQREEYLNRYCIIITEAKERTMASHQFAAQQTFLNPIFAKELCYLQLRMICECIALACLLAHEDIAAIKSSKFQKETSSDKLMTMLSGLHPDFYPIPVRIRKTDTGVHLDDYSVDVLTKNELIRLARYCGEKLHRGPIQKYVFRPTEAQLSEDFRKITVWCEKIIRLLDQHRINLASGVELLICWLADEKGNVAAAFGKSPQQIL